MDIVITSSYLTVTPQGRNPDVIWRSKQGPIRISDMTTLHLNNSIIFLQKAILRSHGGPRNKSKKVLMHLKTEMQHRIDNNTKKWKV